MRCARCGNENPGQNRFCGMCGASLLAAPAPKPVEAQPVSVAASPTTTEAVAEPAKDSTRSAVERPSSISGPSFLGLNDPAAGRNAPRKRASLSIDPHPAPGSNLDYLLDEEEPPHHWGIGKILLILIALGLAAGFGYLRFKNQGLAFLNPPKKPTAVAQNSPTPDTTTTTPSSPSITPESQPAPQPAAAAPPQPTTAAPGNPPSSIPSTGTTPDTAAPSIPAPSTPAPSDTAKSNDATPAASSDQASAPADTERSAAPTSKDSSTAKDAGPDTPAPAAARKPVEKPKPAPKAPAPKPSAASRSASAYDPVVEAQKYLYGHGAPQDCDRGLRLLRPAANQANPKAMIEMGALYSAGLCAPHDLPTAYRWFALALRKDPENTSVQADLQKLWGEMTQPERQLAIKLTQ